MTTETGNPPAAAGDIPAAAAMTDEQIWKELDREDSAPDADDLPAPADTGDGGDNLPEGWDGADDDADGSQETSKAADPVVQADDPWATAPPEILKYREKTEHTIRSLNGRVRALTKRHMEARQSPSDDDTKALAATKMVLAEKASEYPDILGPVVETIDRLESRFARLDEAGEQDRLELVKEEWGTFTSIHADGFKVIESNAAQWTSWLKEQPQDVRDVIEANKDAIVDGQAAADVVTRFKQHLTPATPPAPEPTIDPRRERQLRGAQATPSRSLPVTADPTIGEMTDEQYWAYLERQDQAASLRKG